MKKNCYLPFGNVSDYNMVMLDKDQIYELRMALGLTAKALGEIIGVTANTVFRWEAGSKFPSRRHQIALNKLADKAKQSLQSA